MLGTKLHRPPVVQDIIKRTDLIQELEANIDKPLTLFSAPAGYGKSITMYTA